MTRIWAIAGLVIKEIFRKKDFYVALILTGVLLIYASRLSFYDIGNAGRYLKELGLALIYFFTAILTVPLAARQYPAEVQQRTLAVLLAKPVHRREFILGKFLGSFLAGAVCFLVYYAVFLGLSGLKSGAPDPATAFQTALLFILALMMLAAVATGLSFYMTTGANVSVSLLLFALMIAYGPSLAGTGGRAGAVVYWLLPHFELFDMRQRLVHDLGPVAPAVLAALGLYAATCTGFFLLAGWVKFKRTVL